MNQYFFLRLGIAFIFCGLPLTFIPHAVRADGFRNPFQSASATGQGAAFLAQADDPSAIHYNPAGMTQLPGVQHSFGVAFVSPHTTFRSSTGVKVENSVSGGVVGLPPPGHIFFTWNWQDYDIGFFRRFAFGLGVESLFGFANNYPSSGPFANVVTKVQLPLLDIKPTIAFKVHDMLSIGFGVDIFTFASFLGEGHAERQSIAVGNIPGTAPGDRLELTGSGTTAGINVSLLATPIRNEDGKPLLNLGFVWRSQAVLPLNGQLLSNGQVVADSSSSIKFPEIYEWGIAGWPLRNREHEWKVEVDVHFVRWQTIRNFDTTLSNGLTISQPQQWDNSVTVFVGTEFSWLQVEDLPDWNLATRAGYIRTHSPIPDANFDPAVPDSDNHTFSVGVGFSCFGQAHFLGLFDCHQEGNGWMVRKGLAVDLAYQYVRWDTRKVTGNSIPMLNGTYKTRTHAGMITVQLNF
ncbi:MAG: outer membrane protein transport protein [Nitrospirota bacterium]|nr:outer membrane protein transport protein [Nitrospirota bacterium]